MDFEEHEEQEEEMGMGVPPGYESLRNSPSGRPKMGGEVAASAGGGGGRKTVRYRECLKNHAVSIGGHAVDGCCEFMAAGTEGTLDAIKCAACNCHRNFHRKEPDGGGEPGRYPHHQFSSYYGAPPPAEYLHLTPPPPQHWPLALSLASGGGYSRQEDDVSNPSSSGGGLMKKRFRTKFTQEQKEKLLAFAERVGWRIQKHDEDAVEQFCGETGVKRHVLKVWMHNNKHTVGKKP